MVDVDDDDERGSAAYSDENEVLETSGDEEIDYTRHYSHNPFYVVSANSTPSTSVDDSIT